MKRKHHFWPVVLVLSLLLCSCSGAMVAVEDTGFSDVAADAWYADAAQYVRDNGVMSGTSATAFSPAASWLSGQRFSGSATPPPPWPPGSGRRRCGRPCTTAPPTSAWARWRTP